MSYAHGVTCEATPNRILYCSYHMLIAIRVDPLFVTTNVIKNLFCMYLFIFLLFMLMEFCVLKSYLKRILIARNLIVSIFFIAEFLN